ncbi:MAG TPA: hypothetical protein VII40_00970, partial [Xanthobacteraceae bacterium]
MRLEPWATNASGATCALGASFKTPFFAARRKAPQRLTEKKTGDFGPCCDSFVFAIRRGEHNMSWTKTTRKQYRRDGLR